MCGYLDKEEEVPEEEEDEDEEDEVSVRWTIHE